MRRKLGLSRSTADMVQDPCAHGQAGKHSQYVGDCPWYACPLIPHIPPLALTLDHRSRPREIHPDRLPRSTSRYYLRRQSR